MRVLLIDDETEHLTRYLEDGYGHTCETLRHIRDKQHLLSELERIDPHAVILDYAMRPRGSEMYRWISEWDSSAKIVFYTNYAKAGPMHREMLEVCRDDRFIIAKREAAVDILQIVAVIS